MTTTKPKPDELPLDEAIYLYCCGYFGRKLSGEFKERIKQMVNASTPPIDVQEKVVQTLGLVELIDATREVVSMIHTTDRLESAIKRYDAGLCECGVKERKE